MNEKHVPCSLSLAMSVRTYEGLVWMLSAICLLDIGASADWSTRTSMCIASLRRVEYFMRPPSRAKDASTDSVRTIYNVAII